MAHLLMTWSHAKAIQQMTGTRAHKWLGDTTRKCEGLAVDGFSGFSTLYMWIYVDVSKRGH